MKISTLLFSSLLSTLLTLAILAFFGFDARNIGQSAAEDEIGTIKIWPGSKSSIPAGWMVCDGTRLFKSSHPVLYDRIGSYWEKDEDYAKVYFRIPDLRGVFIRGSNGNERTDKYQEPINNQREWLYTGGDLTLAEVGSFQMDEYKSHNHRLKNGNGILSSTVKTLSISPGSSVGIATLSAENSGGPETRPRNASVHFIIKVN